MLSRIRALPGRVLLPTRGRVAGGVGALASYTTNFSTAGNPISEGGVWHGGDPNSTRVQISSAGKCHGTQTGAGSFDDSQAMLGLGYGPNQEATITVALKGGLNSTNREVEVLLRMDDTNAQFSTSFGNCTTTGYEINWQHQGAYLILGRFKGAEIDRIASPGTPINGATLRVQVLNNGSGQPVFKVWVNGVAKTWTGTGTATVTDTVSNPPTGSPGVGFYIDNGASNDDFWVTNFTCTEVAT